MSVVMVMYLTSLKHAVHTRVVTTAKMMTYQKTTLAFESLSNIIVVMSLMLKTFTVPQNYGIVVSDAYLVHRHNSRQFKDKSFITQSYNFA